MKLSYLSVLLFSFLFFFLCVAHLLALRLTIFVRLFSTWIRCKHYGDQRLTLLDQKLLINHNQIRTKYRNRAARNASKFVCSVCFKHTTNRRKKNESFFTACVKQVLFSSLLFFVILSFSPVSIWDQIFPIGDSPLLQCTWGYAHEWWQYKMQRRLRDWERKTEIHSHIIITNIKRINVFIWNANTNARQPRMDESRFLLFNLLNQNMMRRLSRTRCIRVADCAIRTMYVIYEQIIVIRA